MTVWDNMSFPLRIRSTPADVVRERMRRHLSLLHLEGQETRYPSELSGGERQRVALGRALMCEPSLLLLDEPLSNIDAKLREHMMVEIRELQQRLGITLIYVTHDQREALSMADDVLVMHKGKCLQQGSPQEIYDRPSCRFVADFIGVSNMLDVDGQYSAGEGPAMMVRAEDMILGHPDDPLAAGCTAAGVGLVEQRLFLGPVVRYLVHLSGTRVVAEANRAGARLFEPGETVKCSYFKSLVIPNQHV
jgi:ABC-type Fe3+/spermidine/putrescine transport system ATPase subunit